MKSEELTIRSPQGFHTRPATRFALAASAFSSEIRLKNLSGNEREADAKSIVEILSLGLGENSKIRITAAGEDEDAAVEALAQMIKNYKSR